MIAPELSTDQTRDLGRTGQFLARLLGVALGSTAGIVLATFVADHLPGAADSYPTPAYAPPAPGHFFSPLMDTVVPPSTIAPPATVPFGPPNRGTVLPR